MLINGIFGNINFNLLFVKYLKFFFFFVFFFSSFFSFSQSFIWWNEIHDWDGVTNCYRYLILSPKYLGPNALPVPEINNGSLLSNPSLFVAAENHYIKGDNTTNLYTSFRTPLFSDRVTLNLNFVPVEYYKMDTVTRDIRFARDYDAKGFSYGDLYVATYIQLVKDNDKYPDILLTINLKTASGGNLEAARFTDSPGYYFDISFGKDYVVNSKFIKSMRHYAMIGFYCWQTNSDINYQNDAFLYGLGTSILFKNIEINNQFGGYIGYQDNGDKPMVYRFELKGNKSSTVNFNFRFQQGLNDFLYTSVRFGLDFNLSEYFK